MLFKIGDVAKMLGVSPDLIRYYERVGAVKPKKDEFTNYRYFDSWDISILMQCLWYKDYNVSMRRISSILSSEDISVLADTIVKTIGDLEYEILLQQLKIKRLQRRYDIMQSMIKNLGKIDIVDSPELIRHINRHGRTYDSSQKTIETTKYLMKYNSFATFCFDTDVWAVRSNAQDYAWGMAWDMEYAVELGIDTLSLVSRLLPKKSVHSYVLVKGKGAFSPGLLMPMVEYADRQGLELDGNVYGLLICNSHIDGDVCGYFDVWLPLKSE